MAIVAHWTHRARVHNFIHWVLYMFTILNLRSNWESRWKSFGWTTRAHSHYYPSITIVSNCWLLAQPSAPKTSKSIWHLKAIEFGWVREIEWRLKNSTSMAAAVNLQSIKLPNLTAQKKRINEQQLCAHWLLLLDARINSMMKNEIECFRRRGYAPREKERQLTTWTHHKLHTLMIRWFRAFRSQESDANQLGIWGLFFFFLFAPLNSRSFLRSKKLVNLNFGWIVFMSSRPEKLH